MPLRLRYYCLTAPRGLRSIKHMVHANDTYDNLQANGVGARAGLDLQIPHGGIWLRAHTYDAGVCISLVRLRLPHRFLTTDQTTIKCILDVFAFPMIGSWTNVVYKVFTASKSLQAPETPPICLHTRCARWRQRRPQVVDKPFAFRLGGSSDGQS